MVVISVIGQHIMHVLFMGEITKRLRHDHLTSCLMRHF